MILLDVSTCLVGFWAGHEHHEATRTWLEAAEDESLALCRIAQLGWLRHLTNPVVLGEDTLTRTEAWNFVAAVLSDARFVWATEVDEVDQHLAGLLADDHSHKLWTDDYLAALASAGGYSLATLDSKFARRYPELTVINPVEPGSEQPEDGGGGC